MTEKEQADNDQEFFGRMEQVVNDFNAHLPPEGSEIDWLEKAKEAVKYDDKWSSAAMTYALIAIAERIGKR